MADPFDVLRSPVVPRSPDPVFTADLRRRLEASLALPKGVVMSDVQMTETTTPTAPEFPRPGALPYLAVVDARAAIAWYVEVFDAVTVNDPIVMDDDRIGHADLAMGGGTIYLADEYPELGLQAPTEQLNSVSLQLPVDDCDATFQRARAAGATVIYEPDIGYGGRGATIRDPFGHRWMLFQSVPDAPTQVSAAQSRTPLKVGDVVYTSWWTQNSDLAVLFYSEVLGWDLSPALPGHARQVLGQSSRIGLLGGDTKSTLFCCYAVSDIASAVGEVRRLGGTAADPVDDGNRVTADCVDNQGITFALYQITAGDLRPPVNGSQPGDLTYITVETASTAAYREFYGGVLGWAFNAGRVEDGWEPVDVAPMVGVGGGGTGIVVPMWTVADLTEAVRRVESSGGRVLNPPSEHSYGAMAECVDNQGGRFYLGSMG